MASSNQNVTRLGTHIKIEVASDLGKLFFKRIIPNKCTGSTYFHFVVNESAYVFQKDYRCHSQITTFCDDARPQFTLFCDNEKTFGRSAKFSFTEC